MDPSAGYQSVSGDSFGRPQWYSISIRLKGAESLLLDNVLDYHGHNEYDSARVSVRAVFMG